MEAANYLLDALNLEKDKCEDLEPDIRISKAQSKKLKGCGFE